MTTDIDTGTVSGERDGGQAFPAAFALGPNDDLYPPTIGMTLRDWFAGQAITGLLAQSGGTAITSTCSIGAEWAYKMADAMLAARSQP